LAGTATSIQAEVKEEQRWTELCRQASVEQDPRKLLLLVTEINRLLSERQDRLLERVPEPQGKK
jgi:replication-associated recombination protein RarA